VASVREEVLRLIYLRRISRCDRRRTAIRGSKPIESIAPLADAVGCRAQRARGICKCGNDVRLFVVVAAAAAAAASFSTYMF